jgi:hypothetical protein
MTQTLNDVKNNVVKVTGDNSFGSGFFIQKEYCVTCHHVICVMDDIRIEHDGNTYDADWVEEYSDMVKDIAVLKIKNASVKPLECAMETTPLIPVSVWGFSQATESSFPAGREVMGELSTVPTPFTPEQASDKQIIGSKSWNKQDKVNVEVYQLHCTYAGVGLSGAPVWEPNRMKIVGMFVAVQGPDPYRDLSTVGYVIPIELILERFPKQPTVIPDKFHKESTVGLPSHVEHIAKLLEEANKYYDDKDYSKAIEFYEKITNDPNYVIAWYNRGNSLAKLNKYAEAVESSDKAIEIDPNNADAWINKGLALRKLKI